MLRLFSNSRSTSKQIIINTSNNYIKRYFSVNNNNNNMSTEFDGIVVGCYEGGEEWSAIGAELNQKTDNLLSKTFKLSDNKGKLGDSLILYNVTPQHPRVAIVGLGKKNDPKSGVYEQFDHVRRVAGTGVKSLKSRGATKIGVDTSIGDLRACSEGANLCLFKFDLKSTNTAPDKDKAPVEVSTVDPSKSTTSEWTEGKILSESQNFARYLADMPANLMHPTFFVEKVKEKYQDLIAAGKVEMIVRDRAWAEEKKMGMFLAVAAGSDQPLKFLELHYRGAADPKGAPLIFVGKGVTFDSGGISLKPSASMGMMRGDMGGAAAAVSALYGIASLGLKVNVTVLTPLTENMPSGKATRPGDIVVASNGKTVEIDNTDAEGRLILGDALHYAHTFNPATIIDIATLTGAMDVALGYHYAGCFAGTDDLWREIDDAGQVSGDRMWRMPLLPEYRKQLDSKVADIVNSASRSGGACSAAMFLKEFVQIDRWAHLDIAGVMHAGEEGAYISKGMTGKPVRALIELAKKQIGK
ncbi:leucine aminopeptidase [Heterostelium album PN500]|uniref:Leucine aminopeptidase n=1 Tax=Heterostelium pallidum (strain ATCC 26659 / Pp 5 / PN500) TaxID=670386 RepID=D3B0J5_HETP5|nr:leucine aminopeptidase [Heterostelium album PN500]EFA84819.1 leucine aminopeptidase [Heterostelium album PN500]|eukprot:XP_020436930.1 leucine aminopeptidase [Heterostelium album PN500]